MLELTKEPRIEIKFVGPRKNKKKAISALKELGFAESAETISWRELFPDITDDLLPGAALKGARVKEDITQKQLAEKTSIPQSHISEMENGKRSIGKTRAKRLAEALKIGYRVFL